MASTSTSSARSRRAGLPSITIVGRGETAIPAAPASVVDYIQDLVAGNEAATVPRSVAAIRDWHRASGLTTPTDDERVRPLIVEEAISNVRFTKRGGQP